MSFYGGPPTEHPPHELRLTEEPLWKSGVGQDQPGRSRIMINGVVYVLVDLHNDGIQTHRMYRSEESLARDRRDLISYGRRFDLDRPAYDLPKLYTMPPLHSLTAADAARQLTALVQQGKARLEPAAVISV